MKKLVVAFLAVFITGLVFAQPKDFFLLAKSGTPQDIQAALKNGAKVNAIDKEHSGHTALMYAAQFNPSTEVITLLLKAGADPRAEDGNGMTALICAVMNPDSRIISTLLKAGVDPNAKNHCKLTALTVAAKVAKNPEVIIALLNAGADAKAKDEYGNTAISYKDINDSLAGTEALKQLEAASR